MLLLQIWFLFFFCANCLPTYSTKTLQQRDFHHYEEPFVTIISNLASDFVLGVDGRKVVAQKRYSNRTNQLWYFETTGYQDSYVITHNATGLAMSVDENKEVLLDSPNYQLEQQWHYDCSVDGTLKNELFNTFLTIPEDNAQSGTQLVVSEKKKSSYQNFGLENRNSYRC